MSHDWKGCPVTITVTKVQTPNIGEECVDTFLDTDTMEDLFLQFDPEHHRFIIEPAEPDEVPG